MDAVFAVLAGCHTAQPAPALHAVVFGPERGTLVVQLSDSSSRLPLPFGFLRLTGDSLVFQVDRLPARARLAVNGD